MGIAIVAKNVTTFIALYLLCLEDHRVTLETIQYGICSLRNMLADLDARGGTSCCLIENSNHSSHKGFFDKSIQKYTEYLDNGNHLEKCKIVKLSHDTMYEHREYLSNIKSPEVRSIFY